ncbi:hypothetical protein HYZ78_00100 [Candidatus Microgenomates bacterium]|nr:hypothetical protein [Candidatus Microgenomates bacterium]
MVLVLPALFGLTLVGEGMTKIFHNEGGAWLSIIFGALFIGVVIFAFFFFSQILTK